VGLGLMVGLMVCWDAKRPGAVWHRGAARWLAGYSSIEPVPSAPMAAGSPSSTAA
jgi:hypothetical protein